MAMKPSALSCQTHILCQALPPQQKLLHLYCRGAHWFIAMFPGNICICAHDSMNIDQIAWKTSKPPPCLNEIFSPITETSFNFHCSCWHFNDTGFGLLTEHSETSLSFPSFFFSLSSIKGHLLLPVEDARPSVTRGALKQGETAAAAVSPAELGKGSNQSVIIQSREKMRAQRKRLRLNNSSMSLMSSSISQKALSTKQKAVLLFVLIAEMNHLMPFNSWN